ncbi:MAG: fh [Hyphomonadaceae bacterium]|nr:MAG: fh [Hyphomonadaceae bacterium]
MKSDIEIAKEATLRPIAEIARMAGIAQEHISPYGRQIAKIDLGYLQIQPQRPNAKLILVTAISPTAAGEGKTTTSIGLGDALNAIGAQAIIALREPSLGPCFGQKGGATGGGLAQVAPMAEINLHFTGDFHAITSANNLLAAMIDNHIYWGNELDIDVRRISFKRVIDMNDRALRMAVTSLGGAQNGFPRESGFDITVASEIMAIFCLAENLQDLETRLGNIIIGHNRNKKPIYARDLNAQGAMAVLLKDAMNPNLVQTLEGTPTFIHGGPFANIAHGCNSIIATRAALSHADYVVTEAGFGADLGAEKFLNIKCRRAELKPDAVVIVATIRALKMHGGVAKADLAHENLDAVETGLANLTRHIENVKKFGVPAIVCINHFYHDTEHELELVQNYCRKELVVEAVVCKHWALGSAGATALAQKVKELADSKTAKFAPIYDLELPLEQKLETIAREIYRAKAIVYDAKIKARFKELTDLGYGDLPICVAKTQYSFSSDSALIGAPTGHELQVRELRLSAGAGFVVAVCGDIMTMPGLPRHPAAEQISLDAKGEIQGLF